MSVVILTVLSTAVLIGLTMGLLAFLVDVVLQRLNSFKYSAVKHVIVSHGGFWAPYMVWLVFTMGYSALSAYLVTFWAPLAAGSGIPETKTYLNGVHIKGELSHVHLTYILFTSKPCQDTVAFLRPKHTSMAFTSRVTCQTCT